MEILTLTNLEFAAHIIAVMALLVAFIMPGAELYEIINKDEM